MNEAVGNSLLLNIVLVFVSLIIVFFVGIMSYTKAYRVKNRIVEIIEKNESYASSEGEISDALKEYGYSVAKKDYCDTNRVKSHMQGFSYERVSSIDDYDYCVFLVDDNGEKYYVVTTFVQFEFSIIGNLIHIPVWGETKILGKNYDYE